MQRALPTIHSRSTAREVPTRFASRASTEFVEEVDHECYVVLALPHLGRFRINATKRLPSGARSNYLFGRLVGKSKGSKTKRFALDKPQLVGSDPKKSVLNQHCQ